MTFENWWAENGQRGLCFTAEDWASHGWKGHQIHGDHLVNEPEQKLLRTIQKLQFEEMDIDRIVHARIAE